MAQVFGNRILGGVGAPGGGMSEAFGAGVNTTLNQRTARQRMDETAQAMRMRDIDLQWKTEDREEAKRQRAAAAAAAAATRAANAAALANLGKGEPYFSFGAQPAAGGTTAPATPRAGVRIPLSMGVTAPAPAGGVISGGGGQTTVAGGIGTDTLGAPVQSRFRPAKTAPTANASTPPTFYVPGTGDLSARPGDFAARATGQRLADYQTAYAGLSSADPDMAQAELDLAREELAAADAAFAADPTKANFERATMARAEVNRITPLVEMLTTPYSDRGILALEGPESSDPRLGTTQDIVRATEFFKPTQTLTIQGPNGPMTVPVDNMGGDAERFPPAGVRPPPPEVGVPMGNVPAPSATLGFGAGIGAMPQQTNQPLIFGDRLGAAPTPTDMFLADLGMTPTGSLDLSALVAKQNSPMFDPNFTASVERERELYAYTAQVAMNNGDINGYMAALGKVRELETVILTQQLALGVNEASNFNSAQRLSAVASMVYGGADVVIIPKGNGLGDVYVNGQLSQRDTDLAGMGDQMLRMIDSEYRQQAAAAEAARGEEMFKTDEAIRQQTTIDAAKAKAEDEIKTRDMARAIEQDLGIKMNELEVEQLKAALVASGKLPGPAAEYSYQKLGEDTIVVLSNGQQVAAFQLQVQDTTAGPQTVLVEIGR
jgi:hypothetical protein